MKFNLIARGLALAGFFVSASTFAAEAPKEAAAVAGGPGCKGGGGRRQTTAAGRGAR